MGEYFDEILGSVSDKAAALKELAGRFGFELGEVIYIGDQVGDIKYAKRAGVVSVGFCGGIHRLEKLSEVRPDLIIHKHSDLKSLLFV